MTHKADIVEQLSTIIFNLADIENFDPNIPLADLDLDPMELIESLRAEFGVGIEKEQLENDVKTLDDLTVIYESALDSKPADAGQPVVAAEVDAKTSFSSGAGTKMLEWQRQQEAMGQEVGEDSAEIESKLDDIVLEASPEETAQAHQQHQAAEALEAAFDDDEKTQIFIPDPAGGLQDAMELRLQESILLEPLNDADVDENAPTQIFVPPSKANSLAQSANFHDDATQIVPPNERDSAEMSISEVVQSLAEEATQIFIHDKPPARNVDQSQELDVSSVFEQARAVRTSADEVTQIVEPQDLNLPAERFSDPIETLEPEVTQIYKPDEVLDRDTDASTSAAEANNEEQTAEPQSWDGEEKTQIYIPEYEDDAFVDRDGNIISEADGTLESISEDITQIFTPDSHSTASIVDDDVFVDDDMLSIEEVIQIATPEEAGTAFADIDMPSAAVESQPSIDVEPSDISADIVESTYAEERTQIFIPERDSEDESMVDNELSVPNIAIAEEAVDDKTQIFIPGDDEDVEMAFTDEQAADDALEVVSDGDDVTQIFIPSEERNTFVDEIEGLDGDDEPSVVIADNDLALAMDEQQQAELEIVEDVSETLEEISAEYEHPDFEPLAPYEYDLDKLPVAPAYQKALTRSSHLGSFSLADEAASMLLNASQRAHLAELIDSVRQKTQKSRRHAEKYSAVQAVPSSAESFQPLWKSISYPIVAARSKDSKLWDIDGNEYIDITLGGGAQFLGHAPDFVSGALTAEFAKGYELGVQNRYAGEVAKAIRELTDFDRVTFVDSSSSAVQLALRLARLKSGRAKVVMFSGSYHGDFDEGFAQAQIIEGKLVTRSAVPGVADAAVQNVYVLEYDSAESLQFIEANADDIAAILVEPVQRHRPLNQPKAFLHELRAVSAQAGTALIFDETLTGFRVHLGGIQQFWGIGADLVIYGSHLAAGLPIGVLAGSRRWLDGVDGSAYRHDDDSAPRAMRTFSGHQFAQHPFAMAAANNVLKYMTARGNSLQVQMNARTERLADRLNAFFAEVSLPIRVEQFSSWFKFTIPYDFSYADLLAYHLRNNGIYVENIRQLNFLSIAHQDREIDQIVDAVKQSVHALQQSRLFPSSDTTPFPLTAAQQSIWLAHQLGDDAAIALNHTFTLEFEGDIERSVLQDALEMVIKRHQSLHLRIAGDGSSQRYLNPEFSNAIALHDLESLAQAQQQERYWQLVDEAMLLPFELAAESPFRAQLLQFAPDHLRLVMTVHRLVYDQWSSTVFVDELRQLYNGLVGERTVFLPPLSLFSDFVRLEEEAAASDAGRTAHAEWVELLSPPPAQRGLPTDYERSPQRAQRAASIAVELDEIVIERAKTAASLHETSFEVVLLTAYVSMLEQATGQNDTLVGIPVSQQSNHNMPWLVGSAENLLPLRIQSTSNASTATLLTVTEQAWMQAVSQSSVTFGKLLRDLQLPRMQNRMPLIETTFSFMQPPNTSGFGDMAVGYQQLAPTHMLFDMAWSLQQGDSTVVTVDYNSELFVEETIVAWVQQFEAALEAIALEPIAEDSADIPQHAISMPIPPAWNETSVHFPIDKTIVDLFAMQANDTPNLVATVAEDRTKLFYKGLHKKSNRLAHYIQAQEIAADALIGICMSRTADTLTAILGAMKAGHGFVALDPAASPEQLEAIIEDAQLGMIITQGDIFSAIKLEIDEEIHVVFLDHHWLIMAHHSGEAINHAAPDKIAYVTYRADQAGNVLGTVISHAALSNSLMSLMDNPGLSKSEYVLNLCSLTQSAAVIDMLLPLLMGARVILASQATIDESRRLAQVIDKAGITLMGATTQQWQALLDSGWQGQADLKMLCHGQPTQELAEQLVEKGRELWLLFGSAETANFGLIHKFEAQTPVVLGKPIANTQAFVLDDDLQEQPIGHFGNLYLAGNLLANGYLNNLALTNDQFIKDSQLADRLFSTGIEAAWHPTGVITTNSEALKTEDMAMIGSQTTPPPLEETQEVAYSFAPEKTQIILPMSQTEAVIADIWREALGRQNC